MRVLQYQEENSWRIMIQQVRCLVPLAFVRMRAYFRSVRINSIGTSDSHLESFQMLVPRRRVHRTIKEEGCDTFELFGLLGPSSAEVVSC